MGVRSSAPENSKSSGRERGRILLATAEINSVGACLSINASPPISHQARLR